MDVFAYIFIFMLGVTVGAWLVAILWAGDVLLRMT